jgi:putative transposase
VKGWNYAQEVSGAHAPDVAHWGLKPHALRREYLFGEIQEREMISNESGKMVEFGWMALKGRFPNVELNAYQVMPNHFHGIIIIHTSESDLVGAVPARATTRVAPTLGEIVGAIKSITTHQYIQGVDESGWPVFNKKLWQRNYYEHIFRNQADYERIAGYILDNPLHWAQDEENPRKIAAAR